jgi:hypothetical protein
MIILTPQDIKDRKEEEVRLEEYLKNYSGPHTKRHEIDRLRELKQMIKTGRIGR